MSYLDDVDITTREFADAYDELPLWSAPFGLMLLERVPIRAGQAVLDVGAGTGWLALELAERCGPRATVIAVDPWQAATDRSARKVAHRGLTNVEVLTQDASTLDLPDQSIDGITSNLGINNFERPDVVMKTCFRVAKPGAALVLTTNLVGHMAELYDVYRAVLIELGQQQRLATLDAHINHRATVASVDAMLNRAGFAVANITTSQFQLRFADGSALLRHSFMRLGFVPGWKAVAAPDSVGGDVRPARTAFERPGREQGRARADDTDGVCRRPATVVARSIGRRRKAAGAGGAKSEQANMGFAAAG